MNKINYKLINVAIILVILYFLYKINPLLIGFLSVIKKMFLPIIIAFFIAYTLYPLVKILKNKMNHFLASLIVIVIVFSIFFILIYFTFPIVFKKLYLFYLSIKDLDILVLNFLDIKNIIDKIGNFLYKESFNLIGNSISFISNFVLILILSISFLFNMELIIKKVTLIFNKYKYFYILKDIDRELFKYIKSLSIILFIEWIEYTLLYLMIGHPYFLLLGFISGVASIIPYFGGMFCNIVAIVTSLTVSYKLFILTCLISIVVPIFDSYVIDPKIYDKNVSISPITTILMIIISSKLFGFIGLIFAIPLYLILRIIIKELILINKDKNNFKTFTKV